MEQDIVLNAKRLELALRLEHPNEYDNQKKSSRSDLFIGRNYHRVATVALRQLSEHAKATAWCFDTAAAVCLVENWELTQQERFKVGTFLLHQMVLMGLCELEFSDHANYKCYVIVIRYPALGREETSTSPTPFPPWTSEEDDDGNCLTAKPTYPPDDWQFTGAPPLWLGEKWEERFWHPNVDREMRVADQQRPPSDPITGELLRPREATIPPANDLPADARATPTLLNVMKKDDPKRRKVYGTENGKKAQWLRAIEHVESNAYRINQDMLDLVQTLDNTLPKKLVPETKVKKPTAKKTKRTKAKRRIFEAVMKRAVQLAEHERFYQRCFVDYRGRIFLSRSILNYQGDDLARSLIEFADGVELDKDGFEALLLHAANLAEFKGTVLQRQQYARRNLTKWIGYAKEPVKTYSKWSVDDNGEALDDPLLFIRACMELRDATTSTRHVLRKGFISHIPVEIDQSNSVVQHIALMQNDAWNYDSAKALAKKSGLIGHADLYTELAKTMTILPELSDKERRKLIKKVVVPRAYGSGAEKIADQWYELGIPAIDRLSDDRRVALAQSAIDSLNHPDAIPEIREFHQRVDRFFNDVVAQNSGTTPPIKWPMPTGFTVELAPLYSEPFWERVAHSRKQHYESGYRGHLQLKARNWTGAINTGKTVKALKAAVIHSCDAAVAHKVCDRFDTHPIIPIHDAWACHANFVGWLRGHFMQALDSVHGPAGLPWYTMLQSNLGTPLPSHFRIPWIYNGWPEEDELRPEVEAAVKLSFELLREGIS